MITEMNNYRDSRCPYEEELKWRLYVLDLTSKAVKAGWNQGGPDDALFSGDAQ